MNKIKEEIDNIKISTNESELAQSYFTLGTEFLKIFMGCLLSVFVNQACPGIDPTESYLLNYCTLNITNTITHTCTIVENFTGLIQFNQFTLFWNFLTLFIFLLNLIFEIRRERFIITHFDYNKLKSIKDIRNTFQNNSELKNKYMKNTKYLYRLNYACIVSMILNILFSSIIIFYYYYDGFRSATSLLASILLIAQKLERNYSILKLSINKEYVQSTILFRPYFYNTLDKERYKTDEKMTTESDDSDKKIMIESDYSDKKIMIESDYSDKKSNTSVKESLV